MATPGTKPKPTHLKLIEGNPGKRAISKNEPQTEPVSPDMPHWLSPYAEEEWEWAIPKLERMGLIGEIDRAALVIYCEAVSSYRSAVEMLGRMNNRVMLSGQYRDEEGRRPLVKNPIMQVIRDQANLAAKMAAEFGMTSSSRARMVLPDDPHSELDDLL